MKYVRFSCLYLVVIAILVISLTGFTGCTGNVENTIFAPEFEEPGAPPVEVNIDQIYAEYMAYEAAANAKYKGERLLFYEVEVEEVPTKFFAVRREGFGNSNLYVEYFLSGGCRFILKDFELMQNVQVGYILNLVGNCDGMSEGFVIITDCYAESVFGDLSVPVEDVY